jgi:hypothetical protein
MATMRFAFTKKRRTIRPNSRVRLGLSGSKSKQTLLPLVFLTLFSLSLNTCTDSLKGVTKTADGVLVVEGMISDRPGPYEIRVYLKSLDVNNKTKTPVQNADVVVSDDKGNSYPFQEGAKGNYVSDPASFMGISGRCYKLKIELDNGKTYQSKSEKLKAAPVVDTIYPIFIKKISTQGASTGTFDLIGVLNDPSTKGDYYRWDWTHYYPKNICNVYKQDGLNYESACCETCFGIQRPWGKAIIASDVYSNGYRMRQKLSTISYDTRSDYFIVVDLYNISESTYQFWRNINNLIGTSNANAQEAPISIPSNIINVDNPKDQVFGVFTVAGFSRKSFYVKRNYVREEPNALTPSTYIPSATCTECIENWQSTKFKPPGWRN